MFGDYYLLCAPTYFHGKYEDGCRIGRLDRCHGAPWIMSWSIEIAAQIDGETAKAIRRYRVNIYANDWCLNAFNCTSVLWSFWSVFKFRLKQIHRLYIYCCYSHLGPVYHFANSISLSTSQMQAPHLKWKTKYYLFCIFCCCCYYCRCVKYSLI